MALALEPQGSATLADAWDYKGRPADRSSTGGWSSAAMILGMSRAAISLLDSHVDSSLRSVVIRWRGVREADYFRNSGEPRYLPDRDHAPRQRDLGKRGHQLPRHLFHALSPRRFHRRHLPWPLSDHRHFRLRSSNGEASKINSFIFYFFC